MIWITLEDSMTQTASCYLHATRFTSCYTHTFAQGIYAIRILLTLDFSSHGSNAWAYCIYGIPFHFTTYHFCSVYLSDARARSMHMLDTYFGCYQSELCFNLCRSHIASYDFYIGIEAKIQRRHKVPFGMENETCVIQ